MKKTFTLIAAVLSLGAAAQSSIALYKINNLGAVVYTVTNNGPINESTSASAQTETKLKIKNTSATTQTYSVVRSIVSQTPTLFVDGSSNMPTTYFCFGNQCFPNNITSPTSADYTILLAAGQTSTNFPSADNSYDNNQPFTIYLEEGPGTGVYVVKYKLFNVGNANDTLTFRVHYNNPQSVGEQSFNGASLNVFPNPSSNFTYVNIHTLDAAKASLSIVNMTGQLVYKRDLGLEKGQNNIEVNTASFSTGIYKVIVGFEGGNICRSVSVIK